MTIDGYMRTVLSNLQNQEKLSELQYCADDKDCGYRSALRFLGLKKTHETDLIANGVIYQNAKFNQKPKIFTQKQLGFDWA